MDGESQPPLLSVVFVSYRCRELLRRSLSSLIATTTVPHEIIVVNDESGDGTVEMLQSEFPSVVLVCNPTRSGIGKTRRQGASLAKGRFILFLDTDTEVITPAADGLVRFLERHDDVGVVGCRMLYPDGSLQATCRSFAYPHIAILRRSPLGRVWPFSLVVKKYLGGDWNLTQIAFPDYVSGACMMTPARIMREVGAIAEYTFGPEDQEYCYRVGRAGYEIVYLPNFTMIHHYQRMTAKWRNWRLFVTQLVESVDFYGRMLPDILRGVHATQVRRRALAVPESTNQVAE